MYTLYDQGLSPRITHRTSRPANSYARSGRLTAVLGTRAVHWSLVGVTHDAYRDSQCTGQRCGRGLQQTSPPAQLPRAGEATGKGDPADITSRRLSAAQGSDLQVLPWDPRKDRSQKLSAPILRGGHVGPSQGAASTLHRRRYQRFSLTRGRIDLCSSVVGLMRVNSSEGVDTWLPYRMASPAGRGLAHPLRIFLSRHADTRREPAAWQWELATNRSSPGPQAVYYSGGRLQPRPSRLVPSLLFRPSDQLFGH